MFTPVRLAHLVAVQLASLPVPACRHASRNARAWMGSGMTTSNFKPKSRRTEQLDISEENLDMDEVEAELKSIVKVGKKKEKAAKFHKIRRQLSSPGAPERRLSWDAIQQIKYLKQESPQEWTLQRLAEGFSVSTDVISRVLRSKFTPPPERQIEQDTKVLATVRQLSPRDSVTARVQKGQSSLPLPDSTLPARISSGNTSSVTALTSGALVPMEGEKGLILSDDNVTAVTKRAAQVSVMTQSKSQEQPEVHEDTNVEETSDLQVQEEEKWDGEVLTEEQLEELVHTLQNKPSVVEQKGRDFYDSDGNFLYRI
ncbi:neugrin [Trichomycterus rosablanca]|uniref:neugrin n=1 Tax=Trichomycterus rosablanca TaxID=2290929 RepID=UPI002F357257